MQLFNREALLDILRSHGLGGWTESLQQLSAERLAPSQHGTLDRWIAAWEQLPTFPKSSWNADGPAVTWTSLGYEPNLDEQQVLRQALMQFHPWRKGPFDFFGVHVDSEWRSNLKWDRIRQAMDFSDRCVLDVGSGNGYYGWRMLAAGARWVLGCDPTLLYVMQFEAARKFASHPERNFVVPLGDVDLPDDLRCFDVTCSMGVLYHRTSPIDHLQKLHSTLKSGGQLLLETLVIADKNIGGESSAGNDLRASQPSVLVPSVLIPHGRYAKMRNVWFIPSIDMLRLWLRRTGFRDVEVIDVSITTSQEQRATEWMTFESLRDFLDPGDPARTVEGYPGPTRAILTARA